MHHNGCKDPPTEPTGREESEGGVEESSLAVEASGVDDTAKSILAQALLQVFGLTSCTVWLQSFRT